MAAFFYMMVPIVFVMMTRLVWSKMNIAGLPAASGDNLDIGNGEVGDFHVHI